MRPIVKVFWIQLFMLVLGLAAILFMVLNPVMTSSFYVALALMCGCIFLLFRSDLWIDKVK
jgi:hypothetical protein